MTTPHKATAEQWSQIEGYAATDLNDDYASCLLDIRARVEALEEAENDRRFEQAKAIIDKPAPAPAPAQPEPEGPTDEDMDDLADDLPGIVLPEGSGARLIKRALELWGRPAPDHWQLADQVQSLRARVEALESAQRPAESPAAERVRDLQDRIATGTVTLQDALEEMTGLRVTPAPASSLVERVAEAMQPGTFDWSAYEGEARAAIRAVAAWLKQEGIEAWAADRLLEEVNR